VVEAELTSLNRDRSSHKASAAIGRTKNVYRETRALFQTLGEQVYSHERLSPSSFVCYILPLIPRSHGIT